MFAAYGTLESCIVSIVKGYIESVEKVHPRIGRRSADAILFFRNSLISIPVSLISIPVDISIPMDKP